MWLCGSCSAVLFPVPCLGTEVQGHCGVVHAVILGSGRRKFIPTAKGRHIWMRAGCSWLPARINKKS